jgi:IS1 family transposase
MVNPAPVPNSNTLSPRLRRPVSIERWLKTTALYAQNFNEQYLKGYDITEVQADEIRTFVGSRKNVQRLFTAIEVSSRLWISMAVGKRTYQNVKRCLCQFLTNGCISEPFLFTTDGLELYRWFVQRYLKGMAIYGQIIKKRSKNRVRCVDRTLFSGTQDDLKQVLLDSEDSHTLNTSFVERHNLIIRQGCAYLRRKTPSHARDVRTLKEQLELCQCYNNFIKPQSALKFGSEVRIHAKKAGLVLREILC